MEGRGSPPDLEASREGSFALAAALHAGLHRAPDRADVVPYLVFVAPRELVLEDEGADGPLASVAESEELGARRERVRHAFGPGGHGGGLRRSRLAHDEASADRVVVALQQRVAPCVDRGEGHPVRVLRERLKAMEDENRRLKLLVAELSLHGEALKAVIRKNGWSLPV